MNRRVDLFEKKRDCLAYALAFNQLPSFLLFVVIEIPPSPPRR